MVREKDDSAAFPNRDDRLINLTVGNASQLSSPLLPAFHWTKGEMITNLSRFFVNSIGA